MPVPTHKFGAFKIRRPYQAKCTSLTLAPSRARTNATISLPVEKTVTSHETSSIGSAGYTKTSKTINSNISAMLSPTSPCLSSPLLVRRITSPAPASITPGCFVPVSPLLLPRKQSEHDKIRDKKHAKRRAMMERKRMKKEAKRRTPKTSNDQHVECEKGVKSRAMKSDARKRARRKKERVRQEKEKEQRDDKRLEQHQKRSTTKQKKTVATE